MSVESKRPPMPGGLGCDRDGDEKVQNILDKVNLMINNEISVTINLNCFQI